MDGLLLDSEPYWQRAEIKVFKSVGLEMTHQMCEQTVGVKTDEVVAHWFRSENLKGKSQQQVAAEIIAEVKRIIEVEAVPLPGVNYILEFFKRKKIPVALASSSDISLIETVIDKFQIRKYFQVIQSASNENFGKPHPAVFISTANRLNVQTQGCLVFEDSFNGLLAAKAAKMKTVVIPDKKDFQNPHFIIADLRLKSLLDFKDAQFQHLNSD